MRGGGAHLAIDVVGYFRHPDNYVDTGTIGGAATIGGGAGNTAIGTLSVVAGGHGNVASQLYSTIGGGSTNVASEIWTTVAGGGQNLASKDGATVSGGVSNHATGAYSTVLGGDSNIASGDNSVAAGEQARADGHKCFAFSNWSVGPGGCLGTPFVARFSLDHGLSVDYFSPRADGGGNRWVHFGDLLAGQTIATWTGAFLSNAGVWVPASSSKASKTDFAPVDGQEVLAQVARLPITTWRYKEGEGEVRHMGPMAEDFDAAFGVGYGPQTIADLDARGVALAAIQGLNAKLEERIGEQQREIADLRERVSATEGVRAELALIKAMLAELQRSRAVVAAN